GLKSSPTEQGSEEEADLLRARIAGVEGALVALSLEHERGEIGVLQFERLTSAYQQEQAQLEQQLAPLQEAVHEPD
ncbi:MAG TPA: hypothetical protein VID72_11885, partial [Ktedonobacterales bacterium]